jgi:hypothetical protein
MDSNIDPPAAEQEAGPHELRVIEWRYPDGSVASSCPLTPKTADALADAFAKYWPAQTHWTRRAL